jgi:hypothetical protein
MAMMIDMRGQRFGRLVVAVEEVTNKRGDAQWGCICDCGGRTVVRGDSLRRGATLSCGCIRREANRQRALDRLPTVPKPRKPRARMPRGGWRAVFDKAFAAELKRRDA